MVRIAAVTLAFAATAFTAAVDSTGAADTGSHVARGLTANFFLHKRQGKADDGLGGAKSNSREIEGTDDIKKKLIESTECFRKAETSLQQEIMQKMHASIREGSGGTDTGKDDTGKNGLGDLVNKYDDLHQQNGAQKECIEKINALLGPNTSGAAENDDAQVGKGTEGPDDASDPNKGAKTSPEKE